MNINLRVYETFTERLKRLINESGLNETKFAKKIKKNRSSINRYLTGEYEPRIDTLILIADCFNVTLDYLLCRKSAVLSLKSHNDNTYIYDKTEFGFGQLTKEYDDFLASISGNEPLVKSSSNTIALMSLLVTIQLRDTILIYKNKDTLSIEDCQAYLNRSDLVHKIVSFLMYQLSHDFITDFQPVAQIAYVEINVNKSVLNCIKSYVERSDGLNDLYIEMMLLTLENTVRA